MVKYIFIITVLSCLLLISCNGGELADNVQNGFLEGNVTIGPIWPVERPGDNPPIPPEFYEARKIMVYDENEMTLIEQVDIIPSGDYGYYRVELKPGVYLLDINRIGIDHSNDVPTKVTIEPGQTVKINIDIDTGIR